MNQKDQFILCVQTIAIVRDIRGNHKQAGSIVSHAMAETNQDVAKRVTKHDGRIDGAASEFMSEVCGDWQ